MKKTIAFIGALALMLVVGLQTKAYAHGDESEGGRENSRFTVATSGTSTIIFDRHGRNRGSEGDDDELNSTSSNEDLEDILEHGTSTVVVGTTTTSTASTTEQFIRIQNMINVLQNLINQLRSLIGL